MQRQHQPKSDGLARQIRMALGALRWPQRELHRRTDLAPNTISRALKDDTSRHATRLRTLERLKAECEKAGYRFQPNATERNTANV